MDGAGADGSPEPPGSRATAPGVDVPVRDPASNQRATLLELFFDLAYVAALAMSSVAIAAQGTWTGALRALVPLLAVWWVWSITTLLTDFYDPGRRLIQVIILGVMVGTLVLAASLPQAFGGRGIIFAACYVAIHVWRGLALVIPLRGTHVLPRPVRILFWFAVTGVPWLAGGLVADTTVRSALWVTGLAADYLAGGLRYPTPRLGRMPLSQYTEAQQHVGERYQQFMIVALGDPILVAALRYRDSGLGAAHTVAFMATFATTVLLWQIYVYRAGSLLRDLPPGRPGRVLRWAPYTHGLMITGIVAAAAGADLVIARPTGHLPEVWISLVFGGPLLFLAGRTAFEYEVFAHVSRSRVAWLVVLLAVAPGARALPQVAAASLAAVLLAGVAGTDALRSRANDSRRARR